MRTILYPDGNIPKPYYSNGSDDVYTLFLFSIIILLAFFIYIFFVWGSDKIRTNLLITCPVGECGTSLLDGSKRCPKSFQEQILVNPLSEVCNPPTVCTNQSTPYAILPDNSRNLEGICYNNQICGCSAVRTCPFYALVMFTVEEDGSYSQTVGGNISTGGDTFKLDVNQSCLLNTTSLSKIGCGATQDLVSCVQSNPCNQGVLSFIPPFGETAERFAATAVLDNYPVACIPGNICDKPGLVSVYDFFTGTAACVSLPTPR